MRGQTDPPPELHAWLAARFGSVAAVRDQAIVKVTNPATLESTIFAPLRAHRPIDESDGAAEMIAAIDHTGGDPFCEPMTGTPADTFGRVHGRHVTSGANAALGEGHHAVLVFDRHDPLEFDGDLVRDVLATGRTWAERAHEADPGAVNYLLIWNCLWRAGGSIVHGHAQALLGSGRHYQQVEQFRRDAARYVADHEADLVEELIAVHRSLGLAIDLADGVTLIASLTPRKEREVILIGSAGMDETDLSFANALGQTLEAYRDRLAVRSFNLALWRAPIGGAVGWESFPPMVRIVDRGDLASRSSDIGAMELFATPIVSTDPFEVIEHLR